jgi:hypothetical protein
MRILFICGSAAVGKDGVGDYTRALGASLAKNHDVKIVSIHDKDVTSTLEETSTATSRISVLRIPYKLTWSDKLELLEEIITKFDPDWISFQFVHYSFHEKGLPFQMTYKLARVFENRKLQIMMHECWVGGTRTALRRHKVIRFLQKKLVKLMLALWKPNVISTSIPVYQRMLSNEGIDAIQLPIFSNIRNTNSNITDHLDSVPEWLRSSRDEYLIGANFGSFYKSSWNMEHFLTAFSNKCMALGKKPLLYSIGNLSSGTETWSLLEKQFPQIKFLTVGPRDEKVVSYWLSHFTDFGIVTTPYILAGKSGSYMAFKQHGISCFCDHQTLLFDFNVDDLETDEGLIPIGNEGEFYIPPIKHADDQVSIASEQFLKMIGFTTLSLHEQN